MRRKGERGFTYLEVLLAIANFAVGFAALLTLNTAVSERNVLALEVSTATLLATNQLETLKLTGYDLLTDTGSPEGTLGPLNALGESSASGKYTLEWDVADDVPMAGSKLLTVTVSWQTYNYQTRTVSLNTLVTHVTN